MSNFDRNSKEVLRQLYGSIFYYYGTLYTKTNQRFAIIINKVVWYSIRLVFEIDERCNELEVYKISEHWTEKGAFEKKDIIIDKLVNSLQPKYDELEIKVPGLGSTMYYSSLFYAGCYIKMPNDVYDNPDKYLKPGDYVLITRRLSNFNLYHHAGIYIGENKIIHISAPNNDGKFKSCSQVLETDFAKFYKTKDTEIVVWVCFFKKKTREQIIDTANQLKGTQVGEYNFVLKNCQHFSSFCQIELEFIPEDCYPILIRKPLFLNTNLGKTIEFKN